jgi:RHS repeat-associated protein
MESAPIQALYEPPLAAKPQLREKPHQGPSSKNQAWHQGPSVCKFTVTLGLRATVVENGVGQTYSARYYNPLTGRFLSRDPEDGMPVDPASLHKYLYAGGDPVNRIDPRGRADEEEYAGLTLKQAAQTVLYAARVICYEITLINIVIYSLPPHRGIFPWQISLTCALASGLGGPPGMPKFF